MKNIKMVDIIFLIKCNKICIILFKLIIIVISFNDRHMTVYYIHYFKQL